MARPELQLHGTLNIDVKEATLADLEAFCAKARELGLQDNTPLHPFKQGLLGPVLGWHFVVPVEPKKEVDK